MPGRIWNAHWWQWKLLLDEPERLIDVALPVEWILVILFNLLTRGCWLIFDTLQAASFDTQS